jgi:acetyl esterase
MSHEPALDTQISDLLDRWNDGPETPASALTATVVREQDRQIEALQRRPPELHSVTDLDAPGPDGPLPVRVYRPREGPLDPVLYLHGGGFVIGREGYDAPLRELASASGCLIVAPELRLAPEYPFPAAVEDAIAVAWWLVNQAPALGATNRLPGVCGDSSGGNLTATVTNALCRSGVPPAFQLLIYPMLDATAQSPSYDEFATGFGFTSEKSRWYLDRYLPAGTDRRAPSVSPLFERNLRDVPATLVATAECDPLRDDGERYADSLRAAGVDVRLRRYEGTIHGFLQMTALDAAQRLIRDLGDWMSHAVAHEAPATAALARIAA